MFNKHDRYGIENSITIPLYVFDSEFIVYSTIKVHIGQNSAKKENIHPHKPPQTNTHRTISSPCV